LIDPAGVSKLTCAVKFNSHQLFPSISYLTSAAGVKFTALGSSGDHTITPPWSLLVEVREEGPTIKNLRGRREATAESDIPHWHTDAFCNLSLILVEFVGPTAQLHKVTCLDMTDLSLAHLRLCSYDVWERD
jgi:hypothetical protein